MGRKYSLSKLQALAQATLDENECGACRAPRGALKTGHVDMCYGVHDCGDDIFEPYSYLDFYGVCSQCKQSRRYIRHLQEISRSSCC